MLGVLDLSVGELAWCGLVLFAASVVRGYSGFGFSTALIAGLTLVLPVAEIVPLSVALEILASIGQARGIWLDIDRPRLMKLLIAGFLGTPIGVFALGAFSAETFRTMILLFILAASSVLLFVRGKFFGISEKSFGIAGFVAGIANGAAAMSGMVLALFFTLTAVRPSVMRATMIAYFFVIDVWTLSILGTSGFYDKATWARVLVSLPLLGLGVWLGTNYFKATKPVTFRALVLWLLMVLCLIGLTQIAVEHKAGV